MKDEEAERESQAREVTSRVQKTRKRIGLNPLDEIEVFYQIDETSTNAQHLQSVINQYSDFIGKFALYYWCK